MYYLGVTIDICGLRLTSTRVLCVIQFEMSHLTSLRPTDLNKKPVSRVYILTGSRVLSAMLLSALIHLVRFYKHYCKHSTWKYRHNLLDHWCPLLSCTYSLKAINKCCWFIIKREDIAVFILTIDCNLSE